MLRLLLLIAVLFALALGFHALSDAQGEVALTLGDTVYAVNLSTAVIGALVIILVTMGLIWFFRELLRAPWRMARGFRHRNRERARQAISDGLLAIAAGDVRRADRAMLEASRRAPDLPLTRLLKAQTAQLKGDRQAARLVFQEMTEDMNTRIAGLRGLYIEAEREGENAAAHQIASRAREEAPSAPWAARALLRFQTAAADWDAALATLASATDARIFDRRSARRQRAVILAAKALAEEEGSPEAARAAAQEAHDLATDLVPAAVVAGRLLARMGDIRRATRVLEASFKAMPHPETADAYLHVRAGDSASDRLKRAETLLRLRPNAAEARHAIARAAIDAREFLRARDVLKPLLEARPTQTTLFLMAEIEEAETGDRGRAREWQARAAYAPRDPAWTADGTLLETWTPFSPVSGKLDAVEWKVPLAEIEAPRVSIEHPEMPPPTPSVPSERAEMAPARVVAPATGESAARSAPEKERAGPPTMPIAPPAVTLIANSSRPARIPVAAEPPRPDDPGVGADPAEDAEPSLPAFLRSG